MNTAVSTIIPKPQASSVASSATPRLAPSPAAAAKSLRPVLIDLQRLRRLSPTLALAWLVIAAAALWALVPGWFAHQNPVVGQAGQQLLAPGIAHWLGTDALGRDLWARVVHGSVHSLSGAFLAVAVGLVAGTLIGLLAGATGGRVDDALMRLVDVLLAVPSLLLSLTIIILLGFGTINAAIADVQAGRTGPIPRQLQNKHFDGEDAAVKGQNYKYAHDYENHWVDQQYLPDLLKDVKYYTFGDNRTEQAARAYWAKIKGEDKL